MSYEARKKTSEPEGLAILHCPNCKVGIALFEQVDIAALNEDPDWSEQDIDSSYEEDDNLPGDLERSDAEISDMLNILRRTNSEVERLVGTSLDLRRSFMRTSNTKCTLD